MEFKVGDVVQLKSGGPDMTISFVGEKKFLHGDKVPTVSCTWFEGNKLNKEPFKSDLLTKVEN